MTLLEACYLHGFDIGSIVVKSMRGSEHDEAVEKELDANLSLVRSLSHEQKELYDTWQDLKNENDEEFDIRSFALTLCLGAQLYIALTTPLKIEDMED